MALSHGLLAEEDRLPGAEQLKQGKLLFQQNCAACHGSSAESVANWKERNNDGNYPPPPLDGSGHTWHHSPQLLKKTIKQGGIQNDGVMPPFGSLLNEADMESIIAYFQSKWPDRIYRSWADRFKVATTTSSQPDITRLLKSRLGTNRISEPKETEVKGIYEARFGKKYAYLTEDGNYVFIGEMVDLKNGRNLTELSRRALVSEELRNVPVSRLAVFPAKDTEKAVLYVFTDTSCPFCKKLHAEIGFLQAAGITIRYFPYPRGGSRGPGYQTLKQVWCAGDKAKAISIAKGTDVGDLPDGDCAAANFVDEGFKMGNRLGMTGTPTLFTETGAKITGYVPYRQLIRTVLKDL